MARDYLMTARKGPASISRHAAADRHPIGVDVTIGIDQSGSFPLRSGYTCASSGSSEYTIIPAAESTSLCGLFYVVSEGARELVKPIAAPVATKLHFLV